MDSLTVFKKAVPRGSNLILTGVNNALNLLAEKYGLTTTRRLSAFMAQAAHETGHFTSLREFGKDSYFNRYEGRKDLGNIIPGDGLKFKGRGIFQITGRTNYEAISKKMFGDTRLLKNPELLEQPYNATLSALLYWNARNFNAIADRGTPESFTQITRRINGGLNGAKEREMFLERFLSLINPVSTGFFESLLKKKFSPKSIFSSLINNWVNSAQERLK